jgi:MarR family transcriptional regulator, 2-MHQ and catechol-resistance regulon repressor
VTKYNVDRDTERTLDVYANLVRATASLEALLSRQLEGLGLTMGQFRVLEALLHLGPMSHAALCRRLLCGHGNMSVLIANLERRGLIDRKARSANKHRKTPYLSPKGKKLIEEVFPFHARLVRAQMGALTNREQEALRRMCAKLGHADPVRFVAELARAEGMTVATRSTELPDRSAITE